MHRAARGSSALLIATSCGGAPDSVMPETALESTRPQATVTLGGPTSEPCQLGKLSDVVPPMEIETLLSNPEPY